MSFVASLPKPPGADILLALNEFFRVPDAATREFIPVKERSHGIFRDEKRLEKVLAGQLGSPGRLTLELLRCYKVPLVPVHLTFPAAKGDAIIIENEATFDSIARWNRIHFQFRFVVYGRGLEIMKATHFLLRQIAHPGIRYYYFGDVDPGGILIPWNLSRILQRETDARLLPAETCYRLLFRQGSSTPTPFDDAVKQTPTDAGINLDWRKALDWLPADLRSPVNVLLTRDQRIAQEAASWEILRNESSLI
ncbi:MAG: DUF2220 family protein [Opitutaceae bacterium]|nr:DUF2220 family protein [Opitutaceae bacterium]